MISILLSCYNSQFDYLAQQINSIIEQTEQGWELLIYNDGCSEWLGKFINSLNSDKIKYYDEGHKGYTGAYNYLLERADGEYVCFCDHDDIWEKDKLEVCKKYLDEHPDVDCVFGWLHWFGEKEKIESFQISDEAISKELPFWQPIKQPTAMFRKNKFGSFDSPYDTAGDYWFWSKHWDRHYHMIEGRIMAHYRRHAGELTKDKTGFRETTAKIIQRNMALFGKNFDLDTCRRLDRYSKTYDEEFKKQVQREIGL